MVHSGKNTVVLGLGHSGEAAARLLLEEGARVTVCESSDTPVLREKARELEQQGVKVLIGQEAENDATQYDLAVLSPGIDPAVPLVQATLGKNIPIIGELELAYQECSCPVVAITGSNGKTTTTELTVKILQGCGLRTMASGNIGLPFATAVKHSLNLDIMVLEVSSFQLETIQTFRPKVAAWLNLSPNHLDRYPRVQEYRDAKLHIFDNQTEEDYIVVNALSELPSTRGQRITFSALTDKADFTLRGTEIFLHGKRLLDQNDTHLQGVHNAENIMAAIGIGLALHLDTNDMATAISDYTPPAHRCEFVRDLDGVRWVNDSKATNLDAMAKAILSQKRPIILIAGGKDKGFEFDENTELVQENARAVVLIGEMKDRIAKSWKSISCHKAETLEEAVNTAKSLAQSGDVVLFSPGTSSFDMFHSYGERGDIFKSHVKNLKNQPT